MTFLFQCIISHHVWLIHLPQCHIYASVNRISIVPDNGLLPIRRQAIMSTSAGLLSIGPLGTNFSEILIKIKKFHSQKNSENIFCEMAAMLSRGRWVYVLRWLGFIRSVVLYMCMHFVKLFWLKCFNWHVFLFACLWLNISRIVNTFGPELNDQHLFCRRQIQTYFLEQKYLNFK